VQSNSKVIVSLPISIIAFKDRNTSPISSSSSLMMHSPDSGVRPNAAQSDNKSSSNEPNETKISLSQESKPFLMEFAGMYNKLDNFVIDPQVEADAESSHGQPTHQLKTPISEWNAMNSVTPKSISPIMSAIINSKHDLLSNSDLAVPSHSSIKNVSSEPSTSLLTVATETGSATLTALEKSIESTEEKTNQNNSISMDLYSLNKKTSSESFLVTPLQDLAGPIRGRKQSTTDISRTSSKNLEIDRQSQISSRNNSANIDSLDRLDSFSTASMLFCAKCNRSIEEGEVVNAIDNIWHPECFTCTVRPFFFYFFIISPSFFCYMKDSHLFFSSPFVFFLFF